jgi:hypothetical protein
MQFRELSLVGSAVQELDDVLKVPAKIRLEHSGGNYHYRTDIDAAEKAGITQSDDHFPTCLSRHHLNQ